jgi:thiol-disulfide isomerase/thioredoxin
MKKFLLLCASALLVFTGCNRSGMIDATTASVPTNAAPKPATPARIAHGQSMNVQDYVAAGRTTIFDFTSEYCPPCRAIAPRLHKLHADRADIVVVEVDINRPGIRGIDWGSPVAKQYGLQSIPHFKVYSPSGQLQAEGDEAYGLVMGMLR